MSIKLALGGKVYDVTIARRKPHLVLVIDGEEHEISEVPAIGDGRNAIGISGSHVAFSRAQIDERQVVRLGGKTVEVSLIDPFSDDASLAGDQDAVRTPMPGVIVSLAVQVGDRVSRGEALVTIESMKLQTVLHAPRDGVVAQILRAEGETFEKDEVIVTLETESGED